MIPVTHWIYVGLILVILGAAGPWLARAGAGGAREALGVVAVSWGVAVWASAAARWWGTPELLFVSLSSLAVGAALALIVRPAGPERAGRGARD